MMLIMLISSFYQVAMKSFSISKIDTANCFRTIFFYVRSFLILFIFLNIGNFISGFLPIEIPGSIIGLLLLFFLLVFQIIPVEWVQHGCNLFMKYMTILFVPAAMGIMDNYIFLIESWAPILIGSIVSTFTVMLFIGYLTQYLHNRSAQNIQKNEGEE